MLRTLAIATAIIVSTGCAKHRATYSIVGEPHAESLLRSKTITAKVADEKSLSDKMIKEEVERQLRRTGFKVAPKGGDITLNVATSYGGKMLTGSFAARYPFGDQITQFEHSDQTVIDLRAMLEDKPIWEARISGDTENIVGDEYRPGCIRELLVEHLAEYGSHTDRCLNPDEH